MKDEECTCILEKDFAIMGIFADCPKHSQTKKISLEE